MNYIDLFAGAGGLSEGFTKAGFNPIAHIEMDTNACLSLKTRLAYHYLKSQNQLDIYSCYLRQTISREDLYAHIPKQLLKSVIQEEINDSNIQSLFEQIDELAEEKKIDLIVGGPPCQAYSTVGRAKINSLRDQHVSSDVRYLLYKQYGQFLNRYQPEYFIFENVLGLLSADDGWLIGRIINFFQKECGYRVEFDVLDANRYGVLQLRKRVILVGRKGTESFHYPDFETVTRELDWTVRNALLSDLEYLNPGDEKHISNYTKKPIHDYLSKIGIRDGLDFVTQHITRPHNERDLEIYRLAIEKWQNGERLKYTDLPEELQNHKNKTAFLDRYKVVNPDGISHTVVAHISRDGHYYIYPDSSQIRSLSVREAARIQSFPDNYFFEGGRSAAFKQIGNAVPPQLAFVIAKKMKELLQFTIDEPILYPDSSRRAEPVGTD